MQGARARTLYQGSNGYELTIDVDNPIGTGGEGAIYSLGELTALVAKVYHRADDVEGAKLRLMADNPPDMPPAPGGHISIAWPQDTLHSSLPATIDNTVGYLMLRVDSERTVNQSYNPASRKRNFPHFTSWHHCAVAINLARAVNAIHAHNYVIGDINESNILVHDDGLVTLIDTDSFQVQDQRDGTIYRSPVGKPEYTSPELQGQRFDAQDRDQYHDRFGLGVIIYQLLMEGRHPHAGKYTGQGDPPTIESRIRDGFFLHAQSRSVPLVDGPGFMRWDSLDESIRDLFRLCFDTGHDRRTGRPTPEMWEEAITQVADSLSVCTDNPHHRYFGHNSSCPWCERRDLLHGEDPFPVAPGPEPVHMGGAVTPHQQLQPVPRPVQQQQSTPETPPNQEGRRRWLPILGTSLILGSPIIVGLYLALPLVLSLFQDDPPELPPPVAIVPTPTATPPPTVRPPQLPATPLPPLAVQPSYTHTPTPTRTPVRPTPRPSTGGETSSGGTPTIAGQRVVVGPDLTLDARSFGWEPNEHSVGDTVTFRIDVVNEGGESESSTLTYSIYSVGMAQSLITEGEVEVPAIPTHERAEVTFEWVPDVGYYTFQFEVDPTGEVDESNETNNALIDDSNTLYPGPLLADLVVKSIDWSPDVPTMGEQLTFTVTLENIGPGSSAPSKVQLYMEDDLYGEGGLTAVPSGESEVVIFDWIAEVGTTTLRVVADSGHEIPEAEENNNEHTIHYDSTAFVDLVVEEVNWTPASPSVGDEIAFAVVVGNMGNLGSGGFAVELSGVQRDGVEFPTEVELADIPPGGSAAASFMWRVVPGEFTLIARADAQGAIQESDEDNNSVEVPYGATALADLVVTSIGWEPDRPAIDEEVTVAVTVHNQGVGNALSSDVRLFADDTGHGEAVSLSALSAGDSTTVSFPWTAQIGLHTFSASVDDSGSVHESDETNNASDKFEYDDTRTPDLVVSSIDWRPENPSVGDTVTFRVEIENLGDATARQFRVSFRDKTSVWAPMEREVSSELRPDRKTTVTFEWPADSNPHEFAAVADSQGEVTETDEDNNEHAVEYNATVAADLTVSRISTSPRNPSVDEDTTIRVTIRNEGMGSARSFILSLTIEGPDGYVDQSNRRVEEIAAGESGTEEFDWHARPGSHQFNARVDARGVITETDESNNELTEEFVTALADLTPTDVVVSNLSPLAGDLVRVEVRVENDGRGNSGRFSVRLYVDGANEPHENERVSSLGSSEAVYVDFTWQAVEGCHKLRVVVDEDDDVPEEDESNNRSKELEICSESSQ